MKKIINVYTIRVVTSLFNRQKQWYPLALARAVQLIKDMGVFKIITKIQEHKRWGLIFFLGFTCLSAASLNPRI